MVYAFILLYRSQASCRRQSYATNHKLTQAINMSELLFNKPQKLYLKGKQKTAWRIGDIKLQLQVYKIKVPLPGDWRQETLQTQSQSPSVYSVHQRRGNRKTPFMLCPCL